MVNPRNSLLVYSLLLNINETVKTANKQTQQAQKQFLFNQKKAKYISVRNNLKNFSELIWVELSFSKILMNSSHKITKMQKINSTKKKQSW